MSLALFVHETAGRVMAARNSFDYHHFYRRMPLGQLMLLDHDGIAYQLLISPFGSGDKTDARSSRRAGGSATLQDSLNFKSRVEGSGGPGVLIEHTHRAKLAKEKPHFEHFLRDLEAKDGGK